MGDVGQAHAWTESDRRESELRTNSVFCKQFTRLRIALASGSLGAYLIRDGEYAERACGLDDPQACGVSTRGSSPSATTVYKRVLVRRSPDAFCGDVIPLDTLSVRTGFKSPM